MALFGFLSFLLETLKVGEQKPEMKLWAAHQGTVRFCPAQQGLARRSKAPAKHYCYSIFRNLLPQAAVKGPEVNLKTGRLPETRGGRV